MESYFFSPPFMGSVPGRAHFFFYHSFFSSLLFPLFTILFSSPFLSYSNFFLPRFPCLPSLFLFPILFPFLFFILILLLPLFFLFCFLFFLSFFFPFLLLFFCLFPPFVILLVASSFPPPLSFSCLCCCFPSLPSYLFHLFAKGAAIK